jgi:hypothetical protein
VYSPDLLDGALTAGGNNGSGGDIVGVTGGSAGTPGAAGGADGGEPAADGGSTQGGTGASAGTGAGGAVAVGGAGGGGAGVNSAAGAGGTAVGTTGGSGGTVATNLDLIDNLEDGDGLIRVVATPRRDGIWDSGNDGTATGKQTPPPSSAAGAGMFKPTALLPADAPYAGDKYAAYSKASGFTSYAFMNVSMRSWATYDTTYPKYDASGYKGLTFLAKAGTGSSLGMRLRFISGDTDPRGAKCKLSTDVPTPPANELCYNHYYAQVTLSNDWATYTVSFADDFLQPVMTSSPIDLTELYGFEFYFGASDDYEIWVDDLSFIKK